MKDIEILTFLVFYLGCIFILGCSDFIKLIISYMRINYSFKDSVIKIFKDLCNRD